MVGVLAQAHVGYNDQPRGGLFDDADGLLNNPAGLVCFGAFGVLAGGNTEQEHSRYTELGDLFNLVEQPV